MMALEWNVWISDWNNKCIKTHNVFHHYRLIEDLKKYYRKYPNNKEAFLDEIRKSLMYFYWSKCEWEIILDHWVGPRDAEKKKIDVWDQIRINWEPFSEYLWNHRKEIPKCM